MSEFATRRVMMVDTQVRPSDVTKFPIIDAMLSVPRETFVPHDKREAAYVGENLTLAPGRVVLEARTLAKLLDALDIQPEIREAAAPAALPAGPVTVAFEHVDFAYAGAPSPTLASAPEQIDVIERISNHLYALGYGDDQVSLDLSIARKRSMRRRGSKPGQV